ncbi:PREDICTED: 3-deoxy-manno-octulosonate cytidylyltransferase, mitochondrial-like [Brassica oleracea var. oleracea]|uniref:3-deoxy-manno-octulosonate cytidylyltransferase, mitochondrial-like n=1 Tax=Brassica oleracea var. oleracea TaxID=109376 RepID=UPI0006A6CEAF|nr:PREDICTED: 3-deoxy-manno-octulosonate cytidylyltransferase, mitochondrial-like [Brassica oleracea var. oleracea]
MTSESYRNGTELCSEAIENLEKKYDVVLNIQGDEQLIEPEIIDSIVKALQVAPDAVFSTAVTSLKPEDGDDPNRVKCVVDNRGYTVYISSGLEWPFVKEVYSFVFVDRMVAHAMELWTAVSDEGEVLAHVLAHEGAATFGWSQHGRST